MSPRAQRLLHDALLASADVNPSKTAIIAEGRSYSYTQLLDAALRLASALQDNGIRRGDRVAIIAEGRRLRAKVRRCLDSLVARRVASRRASATDR